MAGDRTAFAVLGIDLAADDDEVERAYRRLIKQHHPDQGGDASRAAEINRAYNELRGTRDLKDPLDFNDEDGRHARRPVIWLLSASLLALCVAGVLLSGSGSDLLQKAHAPRGSVHFKVHRQDEAMDQPLNAAAIDQAAQSALRMSRTRDEMALAGASTNCHRVLRTRPALLQLDRCAAFDDAVVMLEDRDPLRDQGPFSELAVTGRLWNGASALSEDSVAIDGRLDRIRMQVELSLANASFPANSR